LPIEDEVACCQNAQILGHVFDPDVLCGVAREALASPMELDARVEHIRAELARRYPGHVRKRVDWIFNAAGGALGQMCVMHASLTEYVIVFGSPIGTEGYSGRFASDDYFIILEGEQWAFSEGELEKRVYRAGDMHHLRRGTACGYKMPDRCYALEYARGFIPQMLPFGFADTFTSTLDPVPLVRTVGVYTRAVLGQLVRGKI
jgi:C-8 sterol isomerase